MKALLWVRDNVPLALASAVATFVSTFADTKGYIVKQLGDRYGYPLLFEWLLIFGIFLAIFAIIYLSSRVILTQKLNLFRVMWPITLWSDSSGERIAAFQLLRSTAKHEVYVMGVGMTNFARDREFLFSLLKRGVRVRLLMINPEIIVAESDTVRAGKEMVGASSVSEKDFESYFTSPGYAGMVRNSFNTLKAIVADHFARSVEIGGSVELRAYRFFLPINFTISDPAGEGRMILELALPYSERRVSINITKKSNEKAFNFLMEALTRLWEKSTQPTVVPQ